MKSQKAKVKKLFTEASPPYAGLTKCAEGPCAENRNARPLRAVPLARHFGESRDPGEWGRGAGRTTRREEGGDSRSISQECNCYRSPSGTFLVGVNKLILKPI